MATSIQDQPKAKRAKIDSVKCLRAGVNPESLTVDSFFDQFTTFTRSQFVAIESCVYHELQTSYMASQLRLIDAQKPHLDRLLQIRQREAGNLPKPSIARQLAQALHDVAQHPGVSTSVKDAARHFELTCIGVGCFSLHSLECTRHIVSLAGDIDPVIYVEQLVEASERYLRPTIPPPPSESLVKPSDPTERPNIQTSGNHEVFSAEYLKEKVSSFIVKKESLEQAIPWANIDDCGNGLKRQLEKSVYVLNSTLKALKSCPHGVLLHGDQGTGKTSLVESFAANYDLKMFKVCSYAHVSLRDQGENLIRCIFEAVQESAKERPCVLFFDDVDRVLGTSSEPSWFPSTVKSLWEDLIRANTQCFVFGATDKPWLLSMDHFSRYFAIKAHTTTPGAAIRQAIIKQALKPFWHNINDNGIEKIAAATSGFSANDIAQGIIDKVSDLYFETRNTKWWQSIKMDGTTYYYPTEEGRPGAMSANADKIEHKIYRQLTAQAVVELFESGLVNKTTKDSAEEEHYKWNAQNR